MSFRRAQSKPASPFSRRRVAGVWAVAALLASLPAWATISVYLPPEELARRSPWIAEGTVADVASGYDPETGRLATYVTLDVEEMHRGPGGHDRLVLREAGGRFGDLVHHLDAVPVYREGQRVLVFLEAAPDGALRTNGMFFGKFDIEADADGHGTWAKRELDGQGLIRNRTPAGVERISVADLVSLAVTIEYRRAASRPGALASPALATRGEALRAPELRAEPPEFGRLQWDPGPTGAARVIGSTAGMTGTVELATSNALGSPNPAFAPLSSSNPARWTETDSGGSVVVNLQPTSDPLGDAAAATVEIQRALGAWTNVPEARLDLVPGDMNFDYTGTYGGSPSAIYSGVKVILFDDPYNDISDPSDCAGVLAIGGYWRTSSVGSTVNGVDFHTAVQMYVIFNNGFECVLGDPENLAEIATHELGHGVGLGHSSANDAIMRPTAYRERGPRLGDDDRDAAHCYYPHTLVLTSPNGQEPWERGSVQEIRWTATSESGPDAGTVDLEYSVDNGPWRVISADQPNDGSYYWLVPDETGAEVFVRVIRHSHTDSASAPFPESCSGDVADGKLIIVEPAPIAGAVPAADAAGGGLLLSRGSGPGEIGLTWGASCSTDAADYAVYEGSLDALRAGVWDHAPATCTTGAGLGESFSPGSGSRFFLVTPLAGSSEGHLGQSSGGSLRPAAAAACAPREAAPGC